MITKFPTSRKEREKHHALFMAEYEAYKEERIRNIKILVLNRTMTRKQYKEVAHWIREIFWRTTKRPIGNVGGAIPVGRKWRK